MKQRSSLLDRIPTFSLLLVMVILMLIGAALVPTMEMSDKPRSQRANQLSVDFSWSGASARTVEQEVTSKIEGLLSSVKGVESVTSSSSLGRGSVQVTLKEGVNVPMVRFEVAQLLRQISSRLPEGVSYPSLSGGSVQRESVRPTTTTLLTYRINADMSGEQIKEYIDQQVTPSLQRLSEVQNVQVTGGTTQYLEISYDPTVLANYGLTAGHISDGIRNFIGKSNIIGDLDRVDEDGSLSRITLHLATDKFARDIGEMPLTRVGDKIVYLNNLATYEYKDRLPGRYYRVNGLNTVYMNIEVDAEANLIALSAALRAVIDQIKPQLRDDVYLTLTGDASEEMQSELEKLVRRTLLSLAILLAFVWGISRSWKYLSIIAVTLFANLLISVIAYYLFDIKLHIYSLAGITVSFGLIIDASIVMVDHYSYYHDRKAFLAILAALLTTIGSLVVIFFMPDYVQHDLYDFSRIIIVNLSVALLVALFFVPALGDRLHYSSRKTIGSLHSKRLVRGWSHFYERYLQFTQRHKWIYFVILVLAFGIPFHALPTKVNAGRSSYMADRRPDTWYESLYNKTFGSSFYQQHLSEPLAKTMGGTMRLFAKSLKNNRFTREESGKVLTIRGRMPLGGSIHQLNEKVLILERFLARFDEIKRFETNISGDARITVEFKEEHENGPFPYYLESMVIGELLNIGGADWSTSGVSPRGFSNSINLTYRSRSMTVSGYNYEVLYAYAEHLCDMLSQNQRVQDLIVENGRNTSGADELYMHFDEEKLLLYGIDKQQLYRALRELLSEQSLGRYTDERTNTDLQMVSLQRDAFDLWHLENAHLRVGDKEVRVSEFGQIGQRQAKKAISKANQEYTLNVSYNYIGSYESETRFVNDVMERFNNELPIGYRCQNTSYGYYRDTGTQYWLILLIVVIIFFICSILFESFRQPFVIILLIPVSFIGTFLTFYFSKIPFGTGGFASLVLLCGLVVNAGIYILCEYNRIRDDHPGMSYARAFLKAYNHKIVPVFLTVLSTILGLVPFFIDTAKEDFWFSFAVGTVGGLVFSVLALIFVMPIFLPLRRKPVAGRGGREKHEMAQ